jgi:hypothetical protein
MLGRMTAMAAVLSVGLIWTSTAPAAVVLTTADGGGADTNIGNDINTPSTTNRGGDADADIRHYDTVRAQLGYFRFDLSNVSGDLSGATLTFNFAGSNRTRTMDVYGLSDESGDSWDEGAMTYQNAPGIIQPADGGAAYESGSASLDTSKLSLLTQFTTPGNGLSVTTAADTDLDSFLASDTNKLVTFVLYTDTSDSSQSFSVSTKESAAGASVYPTLTLPNATAAVPEPASAALLGMGGLALLARRRRRA